ncbi:MAG: Fis family transcriptional regulator [Burkholderiaceae bacterium]|nr:Fis family transcriptional regulator [Burkholderiaceae bacterium]
MPDSNLPTEAPDSGIDATIRRALDQYFKTLDGQSPHALYDMVIQAAERPLLDVVMVRCRGNISHAAAALGITRNTLRKKLALHQLGPYASDQSSNPF